MCAKRCFTKAEAIAELEKCIKAREAGNRRRREYRRYWCRRCCWWHLTSHPAPVKKS